MESGTFYCRSATLLLAVMPPFAMQPIPYAFARLLISSHLHHPFLPLPFPSSPFVFVFVFVASPRHSPLATRHLHSLTHFPLPDDRMTRVSTSHHITSHGLAGIDIDVAVAARSYMRMCARGCGCGCECESRCRAKQGRGRSCKW